MVDLFSDEPYDNISDPSKGPKKTTPETYEGEPPMSFRNVLLSNAPENKYGEFDIPRTYYQRCSKHEVQ